MIRKISLRLRVTLITAFILSAFCMVLTFSSVYNANRYIVGPVLDTYRDMTIPGVQDFGVDSPNYAYNSGMEQTMPDVTLKNGADGFTAASYFSMAIAVLAGSLLVYFLSGYALRPIKELSMRIEKITEKELSTQLPKLETNDELQTLSESFNLMLKRLEAAFQREKRFTSDAAHELKTPLTVINTNLDVLYECRPNEGTVSKHTGSHKKAGKSNDCPCRRPFCHVIHEPIQGGGCDRDKRTGSGNSTGTGYLSG